MLTELWYNGGIVVFCPSYQMLVLAARTYALGSSRRQLSNYHAAVSFTTQFISGSDYLRLD